MKIFLSPGKRLAISIAAAVLVAGGVGFFLKNENKKIMDHYTLAPVLTSRKYIVSGKELLSDMVEETQMPLAYLHHHHLAPENLRARAIGPHTQRMDLVPKDQIDRVAAMAATPALIKSYLRLGGFVGENAYLDHEFNTTDVCLMMDTAKMSAKHRAFYTRKLDARS